MGMSCEQKNNVLENKVKSEGPDIIPISNIYFLSKMDPDIRYKKWLRDTSVGGGVPNVSYI